MNLQTKYPTTADEFLRWNEGREGKWDFVDGRIVDMMIRVTRYHALIASRLVTLLNQTLQYPPYAVTTADFGVKTASSVRYPDVLIDSGIGSPGDLAAASPIFVAEVLSPSTLAIDFNLKAAEYKTIGTLRYYLILAQDAPRVWLWSKSESRWSEPVMFEGLETEVTLDGLGLSFRLVSIYGGLFDLPV